MLNEFKQFAFKGNMLDLAIGFILGAAFTAVVNALAKDVLLNLIAAIVGKPDFSGIAWHIGRGCPKHCTTVGIGSLLTQVVNFIIVAGALFLVVKAINRAVLRPKPVEEKKTRDCPYCLTPIPVAATRCPACTSTVDPLQPEPEPAAAE
jgi:large conductance mechanosensitive channel